MMRSLIALLLLATLCACARTATPTGCDKGMYVILPDNYVVDLAAGAKIILNPAVHEFALFCSPGDARDALARSGADNQWRIYQVGGDFQDIARIRGNDYALDQPAEITEWVQ